MGNMNTGRKKYPNMFSPMTVRGITFKNRVFAAPATANQIATNGYMTLEGTDQIETRARGGFAQLTMTETFVDFEYGARHEHSLDLVSDHMTTYHEVAIGNLVRAIHAHGCIASVQLQHNGGLNHPDLCGGKDPIGPSEYTRPDGVHVREMTEEDIERVIGKFAFAAKRAKQFGFDMVMLHCGHGWLLSQFLSPLWNKRTDRWGGSLENRARFTITILDRIRELCGEDFPIELRLSGEERVPGGMELTETLEFAKMVQSHCDMLNITSGIYHSPVETGWCSSMFAKHGCNLHLAAAFKKVVDIPVVAVGGFNSPAQIEAAIASGQCDFVALGRQQFADPELVNKTVRGAEDEIMPCLRCSCFNPLPPDPEARNIGIYWSCTVNPSFGNDYRWKMEPLPIHSRNVLVIGGGVGGMQAAVTAAERGHKVTLVEKSDRLGGVLWFADVDTHKEDFRVYRNNLENRVRRAGVEVILNTEATPEYIEQSNVDAVICAIGSVPFIPPIQGIQKARTALDAYADIKSIGQKVVIIGGGLVGCELGYFLADTGHQVHIVEMLDDIAKDAKDSHRRGLLPLMKKCMTWDVNTKCLEVTDTGIVVEQSGVQKEIQADTVICAAGMRGQTEKVRALEEASGWFRPIGDCIKARLIEDATREGFAAALDINW